MSRVATISAQLVLDSKRFDRTIRNVKKQFTKLASDSRAQMAAVGAVLGATAVGLGKLSSELTDAGDKAIRLRKELSTSFDGAELDKITDKVRTLGATPPFSDEQFTKAAKSLKKFNREVSDNLVRIGNLAVGTGESFETMQKAYAGFGKDTRATAQIEKLLGIDSTELVKFGAVLDRTGKNLDFTGANAAKAQAALEKFADTKYPVAMDKVVTSTDQLRGEFDLLTQDLGTGLAEVEDKIAGVLLPFAQGLRGISKETKAAIGIGIGLTSLAAAAGAAAIGLGLIVYQVAASVTAAGGLTIVTGTVTTALGSATAAASGFVAGLAPIVATAAAVAAALGSVAYAIYSVDKALKEDLAIQQQALDIELKRAAGQRELKNLLGKSVAELRAQGVTAKQAAEGITGLQAQIEQARQTGDNALVGRLEKRVQELLAAKAELAKLERGDRDQAAAAAEAAKPKTDQQLKEEEDARKKLLAQELDGIELRLAKEQITHEESLRLRAVALDKYRADEETKRALVIETAKFETDAAKKSQDTQKANTEKARADRLKHALDWIEQEKLGNKISADEQVKALKRILATYTLTEEEKRNLVRQTAQVEKQARDASTAAEKKKADEKKKAAAKVDKELQDQAKKDSEKLVNLQDRARAQQIQVADNKISDLKGQDGVDNTQKIQQALRERLALQLESLRLEAERAKAATKNADVQKQIEENLQRDIQQAIRATAKEEQDVLKEQVAARKKAADDTRKLSSDTSLGQIVGLDQLNESLKKDFAAKPRQSAKVPELSQLENKLRLDVNGAGTPGLENAIVNLTSAVTTLPTRSSSAAAANFPSSQAGKPPAAAGSAKQSAIQGSIDINVSVTGDPRAKLDKVTTVGLDGKFSEITRQGRGMKGRLGFA